MNKKKILTAVMAAALLLGLLGGCGSKNLSMDADTARSYAYADDGISYETAMAAPAAMSGAGSNGKSAASTASTPSAPISATASTATTGRTRSTSGAPFIGSTSSAARSINHWPTKASHILVAARTSPATTASSIVGPSRSQPRGPARPRLESRWEGVPSRRRAGRAHPVGAACGIKLGGAVPAIKAWTAPCMKCQRSRP